MATPTDKGQGQFNLGAYSNAKLDELTAEGAERDRPGQAQRDDPRGLQDPPGRHRPHSAAPAGAGLGREEERQLVQLPDNCMFFKWVIACNAERPRDRDGAAAGAALSSTATSGTASARRRWRSARRRWRSSASFCALFAAGSRRTTRSIWRRSNSSDARLPPAWSDGGSAKYLLGTDDQGRDILSTLMYGARISLLVGVASVLLSMVLGVGARPAVGLCRRPDRRVHHARVRRDAVVPVDPDRAADRRRRPRAVSRTRTTRWPSRC